MTSLCIRFCVLFLITAALMSSTINRTPLANVNTNVATRTDCTRRSARSNAGNITKANKQQTVDQKFKKSFYSCFDDLFKNQLNEKAPCALTSKKLFPPLRTDQIPVEQLNRRRCGVTSFLKRAVPGIAKLAYPEDPNSVLKNLRDSLSEHLSVNQRTKTDIEREHKEELAALHEKLDAMAKTNQRIEKESQLDKDKIRYYEALIENMKAKDMMRHTGRKGLPVQEFYMRLSRKEKIQFLSMFRRPIRGEGPTKRNLEALLELEEGGITNYHWKEALIHQTKFGAGFPKEQVIRNVNRVHFDLIKKVVEFLRKSDNVQRLAYGSKQCKLSNGAAVMIDAVDAKKTLDQLIADFIKEFHVDKCKIPDDERCPEKDKFGRRCARAVHDHDEGSHHIWTQVPGCSETFLRKLFTTLLGGTCKSLTGLCEAKEEYRRKTDLAKTKIERIGNILHRDDQARTLNQKIDKNYDWHKACCMHHFKDDAEYKCMCLLCGFCSEMNPVDPVPCTHRENCTHQGLCEHCEGTKKLLEDLVLFAKESFDRPSNSMLEKDIAAEEIRWFKGYHETILAYRSHVARCVAEQKRISNILSTLTPEQALLVFDFKQKVNAAGYRETQAEYFGKAGVICFGIMEMRLIEDEKDMIEVVFTMYLSDDKTQDFGFVSQAIHHYLSNELPERVNAVHFDSDGAGVFSSSKMKALLMNWFDWVGIEVHSLHISVAGDGKDNLDGKFGQIGTKIRTAVNSGSSFHDAQTLAEVLVSDGGVKATSVRVFSPSRDTAYEYDDRKCKLNDFHTVVVKPDGLLCYYISGYGPGHFLEKKTVLGGWKSCCRNNQDDNLVEPNDYSLDRNSSSIDNDGVQIYPLEKSAVRKEKKIVVKTERRNDSKTEANERRVQDLLSKGIHACPAMHADSFSCCKREFQTQAALDDHLFSSDHDYECLDAVSKMIVNVSTGIFHRGDRLNRAYDVGEEAAAAYMSNLDVGIVASEATTEKDSADSVKNGDSSNSDSEDDMIICSSANSDDRSACSSDSDDDEGKSRISIDYTYEHMSASLRPLVFLGCLRKPPNRDSVRKSLYQQYHLTKKFNDGELRKNDKQSGKESQIEENMLTEVVHDITKDAEILKYAHARFSVYGAPLKKSQIKAYWSKHKNTKGPVPLPTIEKEGQYYNHLKKDQLISYLRHRGCTDSRISKENKDELMSRLARMDQQHGFNFNLERGWQRIPEQRVPVQRIPEQEQRDTYESMTHAELKNLCRQRKLRVGGIKATLRERLEDNDDDAI